MKNKRLLVIVNLLLVSLLALAFLAACSGGAATTTPAQTTTTPPKPTTTTPVQTTTAPPPTTTTTAPTATTTTPPPTAAKPVVLRFSSQNGPQMSNSLAVKAWAEKIEKDSGGRIKFELFFSESLAKATEVYRAVQLGVADTGYTTIGADPSITPLSMVTRLPFMGVTSMRQSAKVFQDLYDKYPEIRNEWQGMRPLAVAGLPLDQFFFNKKQVKVPADLAGMKVIARGVWPDAVTALGGVPVNVSPGDWYTSLERGLVEGYTGIHFLAANSFKLYDMFKYATVFGNGGCDTVNEIYLINQDVWNKLPADLQKVMNDNASFLQDEIIKSSVSGNSAGFEAAKAKGLNITVLTPEEIQKWVTATKPAYDKWMSDWASRGPTQAIFNDTVALMKKYADLKD